MFKFETLDIWKEAINFVTEIYRLTKTFPKSETFGLTPQLTRSAISISLNIAEGSSRKSRIDYKRFIQMALGSLNGVVTCLYIAAEQKYLIKEEFNQVYGKCEKISKMLYGFIRHLDTPINHPPLTIHH